MGFRRPDIESKALEIELNLREQRQFAPVSRRSDLSKGALNKLKQPGVFESPKYINPRALLHSTVPPPNLPTSRNLRL